MSTCKPFLFYGICYGVIMILSTITAFSKGIANGIKTLVSGLVFMTILLCIVNYYCKQSQQAGWTAGLVSLCCLPVTFLIIAGSAYMYVKSIEH
jgi:tetrahydromethanopterin S-methyltransferase subunit E